MVDVGVAAKVRNPPVSNNLDNIAQSQLNEIRRGENSLVPLWKIEYNSSYREEYGRYRVNASQ
jgi:hypothetical protein